MYKLTIYRSIGNSNTLIHDELILLLSKATRDPYCTHYELFKQSAKGYVLAQEGRL